MIQRATQDGSGRVAITGTGKSADVGQKIAGTLNSTGTRTTFSTRPKRCTATSACCIPDDMALVLSHSGESEEIVRLLGPLRTLCAASSR